MREITEAEWASLVKNTLGPPTASAKGNKDTLFAWDTDADIGQTNLPLGEQAAEVYVGEYEPDGAPEVVFRIALHPRRKILTFQRDERVIRFLNHEGNHEFNPGGAASVRLVFDVADGPASAFTIHDGDLVVRAQRRV